MTRGKKPEGMIAEAKSFAERMGYRWQENPDTDLAYDLLIFKPAYIRLVKVRQTRYRIDPEAMYEDLFPDEIRNLRGLPFPEFVLRELWLRTRAERSWRRLVVHNVAVSEIEWWGPDDYTNPYVR
jgi:AAA+ ATPase superfamily predicted ATPase